MKKRTKILTMCALCIFLTISLTGCAWWDDMVGKFKGEVIGQNFTLTEYNDFGYKTLEIEGSKINIGLLKNDANFDTESSKDFKSSVLEVTINGDQMFEVGNTMIVAEKGLEMVEGFEVPDKITATEGGGFVGIDKFVNNYKNKIGKSKTILISSQMGIPIGLYQGEDVYVTVPEDLPKMTRINIDGKTLYLHRVRYNIIDSNLLK